VPKVLLNPDKTTNLTYYMLFVKLLIPYNVCML